MEPPHRAIGPLISVLVGAEVMLDEEANRVALVAREREALAHAIEHPRADLGVTVKVNAVLGEGPRRNLTDVVEERRPADERAANRLPHDLLGVCPDVLVLPTILLGEIDRGLELGEQEGQDVRDVQPLECRIDLRAHQHLLDRAAQPSLVRLDETRGMLDGELGHAIRRLVTGLRDRTCQFEQDDRVGLDEAAHGVGLSQHGSCSYHNSTQELPLVRVVPVCATQCRVGSQNGSYRSPSRAFRESRAFTPSFPTSP